MERKRIGGRKVRSKRCEKHNKVTRHNRKWECILCNVEKKKRGG